MICNYYYFLIISYLYDKINSVISVIQYTSCQSPIGRSNGISFPGESGIESDVVGSRPKVRK